MDKLYKYTSDEWGLLMKTSSTLSKKPQEPLPEAL